jgi:hypothetical protein
MRSSLMRPGGVLDDAQVHKGKKEENTVEDSKGTCNEEKPVLVELANVTAV